MFHILYKTINKVNGKYYVGVHSTLDLSDGYLGSGILIKRAIAKHGIENFVRETLFEYETITEAYDKEREMVTMELVKDNQCYNLKEGGIGGAGPRSEATKKKISEAMKIVGGHPHTEETKAILREKRKYQIFTPETRLKISEAQMGEKNHFHGKKHSDDNVTKMKAAALTRPKVQCPHCDKNVDKSTSRRWHFDNCKVKP